MTSKHLSQTPARGRNHRLTVVLSAVGAVAVTVAGAVGVLQLGDEPSSGSIALSHAPVPAGVPSWTPSPSLTSEAADDPADNQEFPVAQSATTPAASPVATGAKVARHSVPKVVATTRVRVKIPVRTPAPRVSVWPSFRPPTPTTVTSTPSTRPTPTPSTAPTTSTSPVANSSFAQQVVDLTNAERLNNGCRAFTVDPTLTAVAQAHSADMAARNFFDHNNPDGKTPFDRMTAAGYKYRMAAENIAAGYATPQAVVTGWMNSPGHRANIVNCGLTQIGVGYVSGGARGPYWTQDFGTPSA